MNEYQGGDLWRRWILAHLKGAALGIVVGIAVGAVIGTGSLFVCSYCAFLVAPLVGLLALALVLGWAQQLVLWPYDSLAWTRNTLLGALVALPASFFAGAGAVRDPLGWVGAGIVGGAILGLAQWWVLRQKYPRAWLWVLANMLAWPLGGAAAFAVNILLTAATGLATFQTPLAFLAVILNPAASLATALLVVASITGAALLWLQQEAAAQMALLKEG